MPTADRAMIRALARDRLGFERLRPGQEQAIAAAAAGRDVLAVLPTGGGKSAIYELAGLLRVGPTVVVSPLIALAGRPAGAPSEGGAARYRAELRAVGAARGRRRSSRPAAPTSSCSFRRSSSPTTRPARRCAARARRCSSSTRRTSSASGGGTSGPITCGSARRPTSSARACGSRSPPPRRLRCAARSAGALGCAIPRS